MFVLKLSGIQKVLLSHGVSDSFIKGVLIFALRILILNILLAVETLLRLHFTF